MSVLVVTPATTRALTTRDRVKLELGLTDTSADAWIDAKVVEVSDLIATHCRRAFGRTVVLETFRRGRGHASLETVLKGWPVSAIATVSEGDDALEPTEWLLDASTGILRRVDEAGETVAWSGDVLAVTYTYGWLLPGQVGRDLPGDIEAAAVAQIRSEWFGRQRDPMVKGVQIPGVISREYWVGGVGDGKSPLCSDAAQRLVPYIAQRLG